MACEIAVAGCAKSYSSCFFQSMDFTVWILYIADYSPKRMHQENPILIMDFLRESCNDTFQILEDCLQCEEQIFSNKHEHQMSSTHLISFLSLQSQSHNCWWQDSFDDKSLPFWREASWKSPLKCCTASRRTSSLLRWFRATKLMLCSILPLYLRHIDSLILSY